MHMIPISWCSQTSPALHITQKDSKGLEDWVVTKFKNHRGSKSLHSHPSDISLWKSQAGNLAILLQGAMLITTRLTTMIISHTQIAAVHQSWKLTCCSHTKCLPNREVTLKTRTKSTVNLANRLDGCYFAIFSCSVLDVFISAYLHPCKPTWITHNDGLENETPFSSGNSWYVRFLECTSLCFGAFSGSKPCPMILLSDDIPICFEGDHLAGKVAPSCRSRLCARTKKWPIRIYIYIYIQVYNSI